MKLKMFLSIAAVIAFNQSIRAQCSAQKIDWSSQSWTDGSLSGTLTTNGYPIDLFISDPTSSQTSVNNPLIGTVQTPTNQAFYQGNASSFFSTDNSLIWASQLTSLGISGGTVTFTFDLEVGSGNSGGYEDVSFKLFDIDGEPGTAASVAPRGEKIIITGFNGASAVTPTVTGTTLHNALTGLPAGSAGVVAKQEASKALDISLSEGTRSPSDGVVDVSFSSLITSFTIEFSIDQADPIPSGNNSKPGFSIYDINFCTPTALPILMNSLTVEETENGQLLSWKTGNAGKGTLYQIERSTNAIDFEKIGELTKQNDQDQLTFSDPLNMTENTQYYYRIRETQRSGEVNYSEMVNLRSSVGGTESVPTWVYPNPTSDQLFVHVYDQFKPALISLFNLQTQQKISLSPSSKVDNIFGFHLKPLHLQTGMYILQIEQEEQKVAKRIYIQ